MGVYNYTLILKSDETYVNLPIKWNNVSKLRVRSMRYTVQSTTNQFMTVEIDGWNEGAYIYDTETRTHKQYTKFFLLPNDAVGSTLRYSNVHDYFDVIKNQPTDFSNLRIVIKIDGQRAASLVSSLNPVFLELYCE